MDSNLKSTRPRFSLITISFNQLPYLRHCVASIRSQSEQSWEQIIIDPGSSDGSVEYAQSLADSRVSLINEPDLGPADGLNKGLDEAIGEIIIYLNADDELAPHALARISDHHAMVEDDVLIGDGWIIDEDDAGTRFVSSDRFTPLRYALSVGTVLQQATSFKRAMIDHGLRFNSANRINWDTELLFEAHRRGATMKHVRESLGYFRVYTDSITGSGRFEALARTERRRLVRDTFGEPGRMVLAMLSPCARLVKGIMSMRSRAVRSGFPGSAHPPIY